MHLLHVLACFKDLHVLAHLAALAHDVTSFRPKAKTYRHCRLDDEHFSRSRYRRYLHSNMTVVVKKSIIMGLVLQS